MKNRILLNEVSGIVTTDRGLEPLLTESESAVLPLHQSASHFCRTAVLSANIDYYTKKILIVNTFFYFPFCSLSSLVII